MQIDDRKNYRCKRTDPLFIGTIMCVYALSWTITGCHEPPVETAMEEGFSLSGPIAEIDGGVSDAGVDYVWIEQQKLVASDADMWDAFGKEVFVKGDRAVVAVTTDDDNGESSGAAYVFTKVGDIWEEQQKLTASDGDVEDYFGRSTFSGDTIFVSALWDDDNGEDSGAVYVFEWSGKIWEEKQKLLPSDGAPNDQLGWVMSAEGDTVVISSESGDYKTDSGSAYIFQKSGDTWEELQKLTASDGEPGDGFGGSSLSGDTILVGAGGDDDEGEDAGAVYVFTRNGDTWEEQQKFVANDVEAGDRFGSRVALSGDTAIIGAMGDSDNGKGAGAAYVYVRNGDTWEEQQKLLASNGEANDNFSMSVSLDGDRALIGMANWYNEEGSESAYVFSLTGDEWLEEQRLGASDGELHDQFGYWVSLSGETVMVGAMRHSSEASGAGAVYVFGYGLPMANGSECGVDIQCISEFCVDGFCCNEECGGNSIMDCNACSVATGATEDGVCNSELDGTICDDNDDMTYDDWCVMGTCEGTHYEVDTDTGTDTDTDSDTDSDTDTDTGGDDDVECGEDYDSGGCSFVGRAENFGLLKVLFATIAQDHRERRE